MIPARYSIDDLGFDMVLGERLLIRLDGVEQRRVISYDCEAGTIHRYKLDGGGELQLTPDGEDVETEHVSGRVTVEFKD